MLNSGVFFALFIFLQAQGLLVLVQSIVLSPGYLHCSESVSHWHIRELAASAIAEIVG